MSFYVLVEGKTEKKVYPRWISLLLPPFDCVPTIEDITQVNHYCLESFYGYSLLPDSLERGVEKIKANNVKIDYFVVILDSEEECISVIENKFRLLTESFNSLSFKFKLIIQPISIEAWFLGNRKIFPSTINAILRECLQFYDTRNKDPELIPILNSALSNQHSTRARFYKFYLKNIANLKTSGNLSYKPPFLNFVMPNEYLPEIKKRSTEKNDMIYFKKMCDFFEQLNF